MVLLSMDFFYMDVKPYVSSNIIYGSEVFSVKL